MMSRKLLIPEILVYVFLYLHLVSLWGKNCQDNNFNFVFFTVLYDLTHVSNWHVLPTKSCTKSTVKSNWLINWMCSNFPAGIYLFKVNSGNDRTMFEIYSKLTTIKTRERCYWRGSCVFIVNFEQISHIVLLFPLLTLSNLIPTGLTVMISD